MAGLRAGRHGRPSRRRASRLAVSISRWPPTCRSAAAFRRARRWKCRCFGRCGACSDSRSTTCGWRGLAGRSRPTLSARPSASWTRWRRAWRASARRCSSTRARWRPSRVALPAATELVVINSGVAHHHAHGDYRTRRAECERAASLLGVAELRDIGVADLGRLQALPAPLDRRARHVVTENQRVLDAVAAMRADDAAALGRAVQRVTRQPARRLRVLGAGGRPAGRDRAGRPGRPRRATDRRRLWRVDRRAGSGRRGRRRRRARRRRVLARLSPVGYRARARPDWGQALLRL